MLRSNTTVNFSYQDVYTALDSINTRCTTQNYMFQEDLTFKIPLTISAGIGYNRSVYTALDREIMIYTFSASHSAFERKWTNRLGLKWSNQIYQQNKLGLFFSSIIKLWKNGDLDLRIEENLFSDNVLATNSFDEFIGQLTFVVRW